MASNSYTRVTLGTVTTESGVVCVNPIVKVVGWPNVYINCIDEVNGIYEVQLPNNGDVSCLDFSVDCNNNPECNTCQVQRITKCFCNETSDCPDCNECVDGQCVPLCPEDLCLNGNCANCTTDDQCPENQVCSGNGECVCPSNTKKCNDSTEFCSECCSPDDCGVCEVCIGGSCVPKDCPEGACNPITGECVECVTSDQCGENQTCDNGECVCADGYVKDVCTDECVPLPPNACQNSDTCDSCFECTNFNPCTGYGVCTPVQCPDGFICVGGECIEECDCVEGGCSKSTDYCKDYGSVGCGCTTCEGNCTTGCGEGCYCNPNTNQCEANPCASVNCSDGTDCGEGCGCNGNGQCVPCSSLNCLTGECDVVLGCECFGNVCRDSDTRCNNADCSIGDDCADGCGCVEGKCVACDNFSCSNADCANVDGCKCNGGDCGADDSTCTDTLVIEPDDDNCQLTGTLTKQNCCQCPQITINSKGKQVSETTDNITLDFITELRKGQFDGVSVDSIPRLDNFSNTNIAENEPPTSGTVQLSYTVTYDVFDTSTGSRVYQGTTTTSPTNSNASFPVNGSSAQVSFSNVTLPKIDSEVVNGNTVSVTKRVTVSFSLISSLGFPNECNYSGGVFGTYTINSNAQYSAFGLEFGNFKADTLSSSDCRRPLFKWTKSTDSDFNETPFRKIYVSGTTTFVDTLVDFENDGLESCNYYSLETDCTCAEPAVDYVVFCNPSDINYDLTDCNTRFTLLPPFVPCDVNLESNVEYNIKAGTIDLTFAADNPPLNQSFLSDTIIENIEFSIVCDEEGRCTKNYSATPPENEPLVTTSCNGDGTFDATFAVNGACNISRVVIIDEGIELVSVFTRTLPNGSYEADVYVDCGCPPVRVQFTENCCSDLSVDTCYRNCDGTVVGCDNQPNVSYFDGSTEIINLKDYVESADPNTALSISVVADGCNSQQINIPSLSEVCCSGFGFTFTQSNPPTSGVLNIQNATSTVVNVTPQSSSDPIPTVTKLNEGSYLISNLVEGSSYDIQVTDGLCGDTAGVFSLTNCDLAFTGPGDDCVLQVTTNGFDCQCLQPLLEVVIDSVIAQENNTYDVNIPFTITGLDSAVLSGSFLEVRYKSSSNLITQFTGLPNVSPATFTVAEAQFDTEDYVDVTIILSLELEDGCVYNYTTDLRVFKDLSTIPSGTIPAPLIAISPSARKTKFRWVKNSTLSYTEFDDSVSLIPENLVVESETFYEHGANYLVEASCPPCNEQLNFQFCCEPTLDAVFDDCNQRVIFTLTGKPGTYTLIYGATGGTINIIEGSTTGTLSIFNDGGHSANSASVSIQGKIGCDYTFPVSIQNQCTPQIVTSTCTADKYDITITNCGNVNIAVNSGGFDSVSGNQIIGANKGTGIQFTVTDPITGCTYLYEAGQDFVDPCLPVCPGNAYSSFPLQYVQSTCTGPTPDDNGEINVQFLGDGSEDRFGVSTLLAAITDPYDGPDYASATPVPGAAPYNVINTLTATAGYRIVRFYQGDPECFTDVIIEITAVDCTCATNTYTATPTPATCTGLTENNDGDISLSSIVGGTHVGISTINAAMYDGPTTVAGSVLITGSPFSVKSDIPNTGGQYIVRVFATDDQCFVDTVVTVDPTVCECTGPNTANISSFANDPTCTGDTPNDDGNVGFIASTPDSDRYYIEAGSSITGSPTYGTSTPLPAPVGNVYTLQSGISNNGGTFTFRLYAGNDDCFEDYTVVVNQVICSNPCDAECVGQSNGTPCTSGPYATCQNEDCEVDCSLDGFGCFFQGFEDGCPKCFINNGLNCTTALGDPGICTSAGNEICNAVEDGACCLPGGTCEVRSQGSCSILGGTFQGANTNCSQVSCPGGSESGVCCLSDGTCNQGLTESQCNQLAGAVYTTSCLFCQELGNVFCCAPSGQCSEVPEDQCTSPNTIVTSCSQCQAVDVCEQSCIGQPDFFEGCNGPFTYCFQGTCLSGPQQQAGLNDCSPYNTVCREPGIDANGCQICAPKSQGSAGGINTICDGNGNTTPDPNIGCCTYDVSGQLTSIFNVGQTYCQDVLSGTFSPGTSCTGGCCNVITEACSVTTIQSCNGPNESFLGFGSDCSTCTAA